MTFIQDFFVKYYDFRPFKYNFINKIVGNGSKILGIMGNFFLPVWFRCFSGYKLYQNREKYPIVVSFTSFPARINNVWLVVECLLRQSVVPAHIVLYLSREQFHDFSSLPKSLKKYPPQILNIRFVEGDIRSHKKYWYAVSDFPNQTIITIDDDLIYDSNMVSKLVKAHKLYPNSIPCCWGNRIQYDDKTKNLLPYSKWRGAKVKLWEPDSKLFFGSGGGTLFPVGSLEGANVSWEILNSICPTADDIWLNAIVRKNNYTPLKIRGSAKIPEWIVHNNKKLSTINNGELQNDYQLFAVRDWFNSKYKIDPFEIKNNIIN